MRGIVGWAIVGLSGLMLGAIGLVAVGVTLYYEYVGARIFLDDPALSTFLEGSLTMGLTAMLAGGVVSLLAVPFGLLMEAGGKLVDGPSDSV